jgi:hypothetical protein
MEAPSSSYATTSNFSVNPSLIESVIIEPPQDDSHLVELEIWGKGCIKKEMRCDELSSMKKSNFFVNLPSVVHVFVGILHW